MSSSIQRRRVIADALSAGPVESQEELRCHLVREGFDVAQATLSRDLRAIGAVKGPHGYFLADLSGPPLGNTDSIERALKEHLLSVKSAASIVVLRTEPGHASALAAEIDAAPPLGTAGTVAGDDTIFLAAGSSSEANRIARHLAELSDLP